MISSFTAELLKLGKRPANRVLGFLLASLTLLFWYLLRYFVLVHSPQDPAPTDELIRALFPDQFLPTVLSLIGILGGATGLILGALTVGTEYSLGTWKTALTQRPGRFNVFLGKALALLAFLLVVVLLTFAAGAIGSFVVAQIEGAAIDWPPIREVAEAVGAGALVLAVYAALGLFLATLFRGTSLAVGLGLVYALVLDGILSGLQVQNEAFGAAQKGLLSPNASALTSALGTNQVLGGTPSSIEPDRAALVLAVCTVLLVVLAALLLRRRDMV